VHKLCGNLKKKGKKKDNSHHNIGSLLSGLLYEHFATVNTTDAGSQYLCVADIEAALKDLL